MFVQLVVTGLALGSMYGLVALGYHITWVTIRTMNFSQGNAVMAGAVVAFAFYVGLGWPLWATVLATLIVLAILGVGLERVAVRPFFRAASAAWLLSTIACGIIAENVAMLLFGKDARAFPSALTQKPILVGGAGFYAQELLIPVVGLLLMGGVQLFYHRTAYGKQLKAVAYNLEAAAICIVAQLKKTIPTRLACRPFDSTLTQVYRGVNTDLEAAKAGCALPAVERHVALGSLPAGRQGSDWRPSPCYICFACVRFSAGGRAWMTEVLSERVRSILEEVVRLYLATGEPVASGAVARTSSSGLSSPSIRNVMAELEDLGYLAQPHASAGRVPSDLGFRAFVDELLLRPALPRREERRLRSLLAPVGPLEEGLARVSLVLADVTSEVGVALVRSLENKTHLSSYFLPCLFTQGIFSY